MCRTIHGIAWLVCVTTYLLPYYSYISLVLSWYNLFVWGTISIFHIIHCNFLQKSLASIILFLLLVHCRALQYGNKLLKPPCYIIFRLVSLVSSVAM
uniref:Uncharacterized protein n=1 Tax=Arundo donax TaxID=35708 RepID=A0A0A9DAQ2_ARUDO